MADAPLTPECCYLSAGHDGHDLLAPGQKCSACDYVSPPNMEDAVGDFTMDTLDAERFSHAKAVAELEAAVASLAAERAAHEETRKERDEARHRLSLLSDPDKIRLEALGLAIDERAAALAGHDRACHIARGEEQP